YRLVGGYRTRLTGLARGEAEALFLSGVPGALREMGLEDAASAARLKVSAALLPSLRDASRSAAQRFHLDAPAWFREPETPELLPVIAEAVWEDRRLTARYRRGEGEVERCLEPYGLVLKAGVWYLCARVPDTAAHRTYRLDRFTSVVPDSARFTRDETFDLPGFWSAHAVRFARSILRAEVVVRLSAAGVRALPYAVDPQAAREALEQAGDPGEDGWVRVTLPVESEEVAHGQLAGLGPEVEVLAPPRLRERFARDAARLAALYGT
ncbi:helix-turn-helix transcriptional regulator, partial [Streptomyces griseorubiginosus]|uniref:helix-turn-helix transcriptional regulator n=1 Tax=Streptomyces griseorubiginosus TaxID=67304 RepID=UPI001AD67A95